MRALILLLFCASTAHAQSNKGGLFLADRGTRPLSRGGAFIAGADDPHALWYNPGAIAYSGDQLLIDLTMTLWEAQYTRTDADGNPQPTVTGYHPYVPIPTIAGTFSIDEAPEWTFGLGLFPPNSVLTHWPERIMVDGVDTAAPQRYALISLEGSSLLPISLAAAWRPIEELAIGLTGSLVVGAFHTRVALSACDGTICSFPEDPEYDAVVQMEVPVVWPVFTLGTVIDLDVVRIGASIQSPLNLEGSALMRVRPPSAAEFDGAEVVSRRDGCDYENPEASCRNDTRAAAQVETPWIVRLGVEVRPMPELRLEAALVWETWSVQDEARISPQDVWIQDALGGGLDYQVGPVNIPRHLNDTVSVRLGGQYTIENAVTVSLGGYFENGAVRDEYLSALNIDSDKVVVGGGVTIHASPEVAFDLAGGYIWVAPRSVRNSLVPQPNPIRPPPSEEEIIYVGNGDYSVTSPYFGISFRWIGDAGNIRGPGEDEEVEVEAPIEPETIPPAGEEQTLEEPQPADPNVPWYLRGRQGAEQPAAEPPPEPEPVIEEPEPQPRRRARRRRRR